VKEKGNPWRTVSLLKTGHLEAGGFVKGIKITIVLSMLVVKIEVAEDHIQWYTLVDVRISGAEIFNVS
jgi:hypothetical protein